MTTADPATTNALYCHIHPDRETTLRCNRCEQPMCVKCAVSTPTGYRCKSCVKGQRAKFVTAQWYDYAIAAGVTLALSIPAQWFIPQLGFFIFILAPLAGGIIAEAVRWATGRRWGPYLGYVVMGTAILADLPIIMLGLLSGVFGLILWHILYLVLVSGVVLARIRERTL